MDCLWHQPLFNCTQLSRSGSSCSASQNVSTEFHLSDEEFALFDVTHQLLHTENFEHFSEVSVVRFKDVLIVHFLGSDENVVNVGICELFHWLQHIIHHLLELD